MQSQALYDLSPALRLMFMGLILALGPLAWVWLRNRQASLPQRLRALTLLTLFLCFDLVLFGAFTRLTDSGLGCPDWPGCYSSASPLGAKAQISAEQAAMPSGPVTHQKAWIEMVHRYGAMALGVLILVLATMSWTHRQQLRRRLLLSPWWPTLTLLWVCLQGAFGALTVTMKLFPAIVTLHLLGGMVLLALLQTQATRYRASNGLGDDYSIASMPGSAHRWLMAAGSVPTMPYWPATSFRCVKANGCRR
jgi:heme a synthase